jgi:hypothetical protein
MAKKTNTATPHRDPPGVSIKREDTTSPDFFSVYVNDIQVQTTPWDIRLMLGEIGGIPSEGNPIIRVKQLGEVRMSPQLAKRVMTIITEQLRTYEERFGEIPAQQD